MHQHVVLIFITAIMIIIILAILRKRIKQVLYKPVRKMKKLKGVSYHNVYINVDTGASTEKDKSGHTKYINVWHFSKFDAKVVLYFHGNNHNISYRKYMIDICDLLGYNLLLVDFRGYGSSGGKASSHNILGDAEASYRYLRHYYKASEIIVWGESLGGSPACYIASKYKVNRLILLSTFSSLHSLMKDDGNAVRDAGYWIARVVTADINEYTNNIRMMTSVRSPVLIIHSVEDKLIPYSNAIELSSAVPHGNKMLIPISGDHGSPKITAEEFKQMVTIMGLYDIDDYKIDRIVSIIDNISFVSQTSQRSQY